MRTLPDKIVVLDGAHNVLRSYTRQPAEKLEMNERDYDGLISKQVAVFGDMLRAANMIQSDSTLRLLGTQVEAIDVLFAEVATGDAEDFRRLIIVENKLLKNPEARRQVLAQALEYASRIQHELTADDLMDALDSTHEQWARANRAEIDDSLRAGDVLVVICGDEIHPRLERLLDGISRRNDLLSGYELCLVSLAIYRGGSEELFVPNVVGLVSRAERGPVIRVTVENTEGHALPATVTLSVGADNETRARDTAEFFAGWTKRFGGDAREACEAVLDSLSQAGIAELWQSTTLGGRPTVHMTGKRLSRMKILQVSNLGAYIHDTITKSVRDRWAKDPAVSNALKRFRSALASIPAAVNGLHGHDHIYIPVRDLRRHQETLNEAVRELVRSLS
jgi:hypothetical protein